MAIPQNQLATWCYQGATVSAQASYASIQAALGGSDSSIRYKDYEIYLQGSYRNDTNIYGDSDVDVVVQLNETYYFDTSRLNEYQKKLVEQGTTQATYTWQPVTENGQITSGGRGDRRRKVLMLAILRTNVLVLCES